MSMADDLQRCSYAELFRQRIDEIRQRAIAMEHGRGIRSKNKNSHDWLLGII